MMQKRTIRVWTGRPLGPDPRAHCWWPLGRKHWIRLCDGMSWTETEDPANDFRMPFPVGRPTCGQMIRNDTVSNLNRIKFRRDSPQDWRESYASRPHNEGENEWAVEDDMPKAPMSKFLDFCEAESEASRERIVRDVKKRGSGGGGTPPYRGLFECLRSNYRPGQTQQMTEACLSNWATRAAKDTARARILAEALINQWNQQNYRFYEAHPHVITMAGLTVKVIPDIGVEFQDGGLAKVKLWLRKLPISERRRQALPVLLAAGDQMALDPQLAQPEMVGVWELEQYRLNCWDTVPHDAAACIGAGAQQFVEIWNTI